MDHYHLLFTNNIQKLGHLLLNFRRKPGIWNIAIIFTLIQIVWQVRYFQFRETVLYFQKCNIKPRYTILKCSKTNYQ